MQRTDPPASSIVGMSTGDDLAGLLDRGDLVGTQAAPRTGRHGHDVATPALRRTPAQLDGVAGELADLLLGELDDGAPVDRQPLADLLATLLVGDHLERDQRDVGADAGDDVGVVDRHAVGVDRVERHRLVAEVGAEPLQDGDVGPVAARGVGDPRDVVEHHGSGALEEDAVGLEAGVVHDRLHPVVAT